MPGDTRTCCKCHTVDLKNNMISTNGKAPFYCQKCHNEKIARAAFSDKVCHIFGLKMPGPRIWTERARIIEKYGYTDQIIIDCLDYIYNIENKKKLAESLCLVTPANVEKMLKYKRQQDFKENRIVDAIIDGINDKREIPRVKLRENTKTKKKTTWDDENYLFME